MSKYTDGFTFGDTPASDYVPEEGGNWIRGMRESVTKLRIAPAQMTNRAGETVYGPNAWPTEREHYEDGIGSYVCVNDKGAKTCPGCASASDRVRKRSRKYYVQAFDKDGEVRIFKFGPDVFTPLQGRHQRAVGLHPENQQPISDRDYLIFKTGTGLNTKYSVEADDIAPYPVSWPEDMPDISQAIKDAIEEAMERYDGTKTLAPSHVEPEDAAGGPQNGMQVNDGRWETGQLKNPPPREAAPEQEAEPARKMTRGEAMAAKKAAEQAAEVTKDEPAGLSADPTEEEITAADTAAIKAWLTKESVEFPVRAQRSKLVEIAVEASKIPF